MNNNDVLKKVTIAHNMRRSDVLEVFEMAGVMYSYSQVGEFFLKENNKKFKSLDDESLAAFLDALIIYARGTKEQPQIPARSILNYIVDLAERDNEEALNTIIDCIGEAKEAVLKAREEEAGQNSADS